MSVGWLTPLELGRIPSKSGYMHELVLSHCNYHGGQWLRFPILPYQKIGTFIPTQCHPFFPSHWNLAFLVHWVLLLWRKTINSNYNHVPASLHQIHVSGVLLPQPPPGAEKIESDRKGYKCGLDPIFTIWKDCVFSVVLQMTEYIMFIVTGTFTPMTWT